MRRARAFTLIELLVVVALIAILLALVGPSMGDLLATQRVQNINAQLVTDIQYARSEAARRNMAVRVRFGSSDTMTCYVIYIQGVIGSCNCTNLPGSACSTLEELRTVQVPLNNGVQVRTPLGQTTLVEFDSATGKNTSQTNFLTDVRASRRGQLRTTVGPSGRPTVCSPDGSIRQVPQCAT